MIYRVENMASTVKRIKPVAEPSVQVVGEYRPPRLINFKQQSFRIGAGQTVILSIGTTDNPFYTVACRDIRGSMIHYLHQSEEGTGILIQNMIEEERDLTVTWMV